jgi:hypothetical protein
MGIANIINTAGGGGGGGSEIITNLVNSVDGAGLRLANQGYISCADVSANRFGTNDFSVEFVLSQETNAVNADIFISNLNGSNQAVDAAVIRWDVVQNDNIQLVFTNSGASETAYNFGYDPAPDLNEPTHYLVSADRSGNAVLYRNGAEIASVSIAASGSANVGNSGQPTVIGSPVNNFGVKGNVYRLRTYSKALSSDEAKNVFDRADVPTALVSNLLLDLDCAYANPTQSTVIQDRGPNNQDGTLNGTITQTNVIKQLNSVSARIGTTAASPADGEVIQNQSTILCADAYDAGLKLTRHGTSEHAYIVNKGGALWVNAKSGNSTKFIDGNDNANVHLEIDGSGNVTQKGAVLKVERTDNAPVVQLYNNHASPADGAALGYVSFTGKDNNGTANQTYANIGGFCESNTDSNVSGYLTFNTTSAGTATTERMRIASDGNIEQHTDSNGIVKFGVKNESTGTAARAMVNVLSDSGNLDLSMNGSNYTGVAGWADSGTISTGSGASGGLKMNAVVGGLALQTNQTTRLSIANSTGLATFSNGIAFQSATTGSGTGTGYTLDKYETGTWTPNLLIGGSNTGITFSVQSGTYTRVGNVVNYWFSLALTSKGSQTGIITIDDLPFNNQADGTGQGNFNYVKM